MTLDFIWVSSIMELVKNFKTKVQPRLYMLAAGVLYADALSNRINSDINDLSQAQGGSTLEQFVQKTVDIGVPIGILAALLLLAYAAYLLITSQGDPEKLNEAREIIMNVMLGFGMIALSVAILLLIKNTLNLPTT